MNTLQELVVGRLYRVQEGDTLATIAAEMATPVDTVRRLNYDFSVTVRARAVCVCARARLRACVRARACARTCV